jgi:hypothetical protein
MNHATAAAAAPVTLENEFQTSQSENVNCVYNIFPTLKDDPQKENTQMCMSLLSICQAKKREIFFRRKKKKRKKLCTRSESIQTCGRKITHHVGRGRRIKSAKKQRDSSLLPAEVTSPLLLPPQRSVGFNFSQFDIPI